MCRVCAGVQECAWGYAHMCGDVHCAWVYMDEANTE